MNRSHRSWFSRARWGIALSVLVVLAAAVLQTGTAIASTTQWDGNGTTNGKCTSVGPASDLNPGPGQQGWLFVLTSPDAGPWTLTATFSPGGTVMASGVQQGGGSVHFAIYSPAGATLVSASSTNGGNNLTVSHCELGASEGTPALSITKTPGSASVAQGGTVTYTIVVSNTGNATANNVVVTDSLSGNGTITDIASSPSATCATSNTFPCSYATLAQNGTITITVTVTAGRENCDPINNSATASADGVTGVTDNTGNEVTVTGCTTPTPALSITKTPGSASVAQGGTVTYTIVVSNTGTATANSVVVTDSLTGNGTITDIDSSPASSNNCEGTNTFPCSYATLAQNGTITITVTVTAGRENCNQIDNSATASATGVTGVTDNTGNQVTVTGCGPALTISKTPAAASVALGNTVTYSIVVSNVGNATANNVVVTDSLTGNGTITDIASTAASTNNCEVTNTFPCNYASLAQNNSITITVTVTAGSVTCDPINNSASASATGVTSVTDGTGNQVAVTGCTSIVITTPPPVITTPPVVITTPPVTITAPAPVSQVQGVQSTPSTTPLTSEVESARSFGPPSAGSAGLLAERSRFGDAAGLVAAGVLALISFGVFRARARARRS